jgi:thioredoxin 1
VKSLEIKEIGSQSELEEAIMDGLCLMDFSAPWCAPCRLQEPIIHRLAAQFEGKAVFARMNIDQDRDVVVNLGIQSIPTLIIFKNSKEIQRFVGLQPESALSEALRKALP